MIFRGLAMLALLFFAVCANAASVRLDAPLRQALAGLPPIVGVLDAGRLEAKVVVVTFFASWCPPCRTEFSHLNDLAAEFAAGELEVVAINVFEEWDENDEIRMQRFLADTNPSFAVVEGNEAIKQAFGEVQRIPTTFVFDRAGLAAMHFIHEVGATKMTADVDELRSAIHESL